MSDAQQTPPSRTRSAIFSLPPQNAEPAESAVEHVDTVAEAPAKAKRKVAPPRKDEPKRSIKLVLPASLARWLHVQAAHRDTTASALVVRALGTAFPASRNGAAQIESEAA